MYKLGIYQNKVYKNDNDDFHKTIIFLIYRK